MALDGERDTAAGDLNHAAHSASVDLTYAPHSAGSSWHSANVLGAPRRPRRWDPKEKAKITAESFEPGANISAVARRHGVSLGLLHYWRRMVRDRGGMEPISFIPLTMEGGPALASAALEVEIGGARVHVRGAVDGALLRAVFDALRLT